MSMEREPVKTAGVVAGVSSAGLTIAVFNLLVELGVKPSLAQAIVALAAILVPIAASYVARKYVVSVQKANANIDAASFLSPGTAAVEDLKFSVGPGEDKKGV